MIKAISLLSILISLSITAVYQARIPGPGGASAGLAAPAFVQARGGSNCTDFSGTSHNCAFGSNITSGHILVIGAFADTKTTNLTAISGTASVCSGTYTQQNAVVGTSVGHYYTWTTIANGTGACTVNITSSASDTIMVIVSEFSGQNGSTPVNVHNITESAQTGGTCSTTPCSIASGSITTTTSNVALISFFYDSSQNQPTMSSPSGTFQVIGGSNVCNRICAMTQTQATAATITTSASESANNEWIAVGVVGIQP